MRYVLAFAAAVLIAGKASASCTYNNIEGLWQCHGPVCTPNFDISQVYPTPGSQSQWTWEDGGGNKAPLTLTPTGVRVANEGGNAIHNGTLSADCHTVTWASDHTDTWFAPLGTLKP
jgi:hypothetical protein